MGRKSLKISLLCGVALLLIFALLLLDNNTPIVLSKNALFKVNKPEVLIQLPGQLAWAGDNTFYHLDKKVLRKLNINQRILWERNLDGDLLLWMNSRGILTADKDTVKLWDKDKTLCFERQDFLQNAKVLSAKGDYWLFSGKIEGNSHGALIDSDGDIMWYIPLSESVISGDVTSSGLYAVLNLLDEELKGKILLVGSKGAVLWEKSCGTMFFQVRVLDFGVVAIAEDRAFAIDYNGKKIWEYAFNGQVVRGDIGDDGYTVAVVKGDSSNLNIKDDFNIIMISREGTNLWTYGFRSFIKQIQKGKDFVYIADESGVYVLSREGLLTSKLALSGVGNIEETPFGDLIVIGEKKSSLIKFSDGR